jgi:hypothetical protein
MPKQPEPVRHHPTPQHPAPRASSQMEGQGTHTAYNADPKANPATGAGQPDPRRQSGQSSRERGDPSRPSAEKPVEEQSQEEKDADKEPLKREEAEQLLRSGHRLRRKGDDPRNWIAMTRHGPDLGITMAATDLALDHFLGEDLILAD